MSGGGAPGRLRIEQESRSDAEVVLIVSGELDLVTAPLLGDELAAHHARGARVVLDLANVDFVDSTGLVLLMETARGEGEIVLRRDVSAPVARLLEVTKTEQLFGWED